MGRHGDGETRDTRSRLSLRRFQVNNDPRSGGPGARSFTKKSCASWLFVSGAFGRVDHLNVEDALSRVSCLRVFLFLNFA